MQRRELNVTLFVVTRIQLLVKNDYYNAALWTTARP